MDIVLDEGFIAIRRVERHSFVACQEAPLLIAWVAKLCVVMRGLHYAFVKTVAPPNRLNPHKCDLLPGRSSTVTVPNADRRPPSIEG